MIRILENMFIWPIFQKHNGNEQQRKHPDLNMTEKWLDISVPETWQKLDRIAKTWYNSLPQNVNVVETRSSMFPSQLRNAETWDFVLCLLLFNIYSLGSQIPNSLPNKSQIQIAIFRKKKAGIFSNPRAYFKYLT